MDITSATFVKSVTNDSNLIRDELPQIAFIGRSNVGKSSVINTVLGRKDLVRSSPTPGFTKEANYFLVNENTYIVDLPGYGYAKGSKDDRVKIMELIQWYIFHPELEQKKIVLILDAKVGPSHDDLETIKQLEQHGKDFLIVANKIDKLSMSEKHKAMKLIEDLTAGHVVIPYSAEKKFGVEKLREALFADEIIEE
jgi:GTP-binding protein